MVFPEETRIGGNAAPIPVQAAGGRPLVSIITGARNAEHTVKETIRSVINQTYSEWEFIIIDDCSTDHTYDVIKEFTDPRIRLYRNNTNAGIAACRNFGVSSARGEWIALIDADDIWESTKLEKQVTFNMEMNADVSYTASAFINQAGKRFGYVMRAVKELNYRDLLRHNLMSCSSVMAKRELLLRYPFCGLHNIHEDYATWLKVVSSVGVAYGLDDPLLVYRMSKGSKSDSRVLSAKMTYNAYRYVGYGIARSAWLTLKYANYSIRKRMKLFAGQSPSAS